MLISIEGSSGVGKSTLTKAVNDSLHKIGINSVCFGGFNLNENSNILTIYMNNLLKSNRFFNLPRSSRLHLLLSEICLDIEQNVIPALNINQIVLYDNYIYSIYTYEVALAICNLASVYEKEYIKNVIQNTISVYKFPKEDILFYVSASAEIVQNRLYERDMQPLTSIEIMAINEINKQFDIYLTNKEFYYILNNTNEQFNNNVSYMVEKIVSIL